MDKLFKNSWVDLRYLALIFCGILLFVNTISLGVESDRIIWSDGLVGIFIILFSLIGLYTKKRWVDWVLASIGAYLLLAPIILWAPNPSSYFNDTLIGAFIVALAILFKKEEVINDGTSGVPLGWSYNPSTMLQRLPVITFAFLAYLFSRYMAFYQLGYISDIIDPVFGNGTHEVITSAISRSLPVPDAGLGSWVYALEVLMGIHGSRRRWHTIPWFVIFFAILVVPAGLISVLLITLQPLVVGAYCFWCLITALCMLFMIAFAIDEVIATFSFLASVRRRGGNVKKAFWHGDPHYETRSDLEDPKNASSAFLGVTPPWNLVLLSLIGFCLMFFKGAYFQNPDLEAIEAVIGALIITISIISWAEVARAFRLCNILLGITFTLLAISSQNASGIAYYVVLGILIILLSIPKGKIKYSYGAWGRYII